MKGGMGWWAVVWIALSWTPVADSASTPLTPVPTGADSVAGFRRLPGSETGLQFTNSLSAAISLTNTIVNNGSGVALGDVDGDGWCDVYFCRLEGPNGLFRNLGGWRFEDITTAAGVACDGQWSTGAVLADVDGDGDLDLLVTGIGVGTRLFMNNGRGRFVESMDSGLDRTSGATSMALADMDGDGDLDLYVANYRADTILDLPRVRFGITRSNGVPVVSQVDGRPVEGSAWAERFVVGPRGQVREAGEADRLYRNLGGGRFEWVPFPAAFVDESAPRAPPLDWGLSVLFGTSTVMGCRIFTSATTRNLPTGCG